MRDRDVELLRKSYEAWNRRDFPVIWDLLDPEVVVDATARVMNPDTYHGHEGFQRMVDEMAETWEQWRMEAGEFIDCGDRIAVLARTQARGRGSGIELDQTVYNVWKFRDGRVVRLAFYTDREEALRDEAKEQASAASAARRT